MTETETVKEEAQEAQEQEASTESSATQQEAKQESQENVEERKEKMVPLSALQKERQRRKEYEQRLLEKEQQEAQARDEEEKWEAATKADLSTSTKELKREMREETWMDQNPDKTALVNEKLNDLLTKKPHLKATIQAAPNRYLEAWEQVTFHMDKPRVEKRVVEKPSPGSPTAVPKSAAVNQTMDVMNMSDKEYNEWRRSRIKRR